MVIARYIGDLLYDYECVVIPGLGGFIVNDTPATINYGTHYFKPPFREVMFNPYLRTNDGLLVNYIAKEENLTYQDAKKKMDAFAIACQNALNSGKQIRFEKVGILRKDSNDKVIFIQDTSVNYNPDSFGLSPFISPAVHKVTDEERIKEAFKKVKGNTEKTAAATNKKSDKRKDRKPVQTQKSGKTADGKVLVARRRSPYRSQFYFILLMLLGMLAGWGVMNKQIVNQYYTQYGSKIPVFYYNAGSYIANNVEVLPIKELSKSASALWLVHIFNNKNAGNNSTALANDDLTFKNPPKSAKEESVTTTSTENSIPADDFNSDNIKTDQLTATEAEPETKEDEIANTETENQVTEYKTEAEPSANTDILPETVTQPETEPTDTPVTDIDNSMQETSAPHYNYFIIAGSFKNHSNAVKLIKTLQAQGFIAIVAGTNKYGMTRVAYAGFNTMEEATQQLASIRQHQNPSAWIMKK